MIYAKNAKNQLICQSNKRPIMKVYEAFEIVFVMAEKWLASEFQLGVISPDKMEEMQEHSEALKIALEYYINQLTDYSHPGRLPCSEIIRRRKAWREAMIDRGTPVPYWLEHYPCGKCGAEVNIDYIDKCLCERCTQEIKD
jgi:hypothetical protein